MAKNWNKVTAMKRERTEKVAGINDQLDVGSEGGTARMVSGDDLSYWTVPYFYGGERRTGGKKSERDTQKWVSKDTAGGDAQLAIGNQCQSDQAVVQGSHWTNKEQQRLHDPSRRGRVERLRARPATTRGSQDSGEVHRPQGAQGQGQNPPVSFAEQKYNVLVCARDSSAQAHQCHLL